MKESNTMYMYVNPYIHVLTFQISVEYIRHMLLQIISTNSCAYLITLE